MTAPLSFAIVGHPNEGKSSIVATLAMDDSIAISSAPGETTTLQRFHLMAGEEAVIEFVDTPGFQNPAATLEWFANHQELGSRSIGSFIERHQDNADFHHDCELLRPIRDGSGIIYVVDGSRPITGFDREEMEILRLTGRPRMAIINAKTGNLRFIDAWKDAFRKHFNSIRSFNAQKAGYEDRIQLLEALKSIDQDWTPLLTHAIERIQLDRAQALERCAEAIMDHIEAAASCHCHKLLSDDSGVALEKRKLEEKYRSRLAHAEERFRREVDSLFRLSRVRISLPENSIMAEDLFSERSWQALGLTQQQLAIAGGLLGAGIGAGADIAASGLTFGIFASIGAAIGAGSALWKGKELARTKIKRMPLGGLRLTVGPNRNPQFPFITLDRDLLYACFASNWAHARRETEYRIDSTGEKTGPTSQWSSSEIAIATRFIKSLDRPTSDTSSNARSAFKKLLREELAKSDQ